MKIENMQDLKKALKEQEATSHDDDLKEVKQDSDALKYVKLSADEL